MQLPCIHQNGTSKEELVRNLCRASESLDTAHEALRQTAPNGRDYYPLGSGAFTKAGYEHFDRMRRLDDIKKEIDELALAIDQMP